MVPWVSLRSSKPCQSINEPPVQATKDICSQKRRLKGGDVVVKQALFERMCQVASTVVSFHHKGRAR